MRIARLVPAAIKRPWRQFKFGEIEFRPKRLTAPSRTLDTISAWRGHDLVLADLIQRFSIPTRNYLEFGVEFGFSAVAASSYFEQVTGVDTFEGDIHTDHRGNHFEQTRERLSRFANIRLIKADYRDFIKTYRDPFDMAHVDIVHTYEDTFQCGLWCAQRCAVTIFHDTESFADVKQAVADIARKTSKRFYNYRPHHGLGIVA